MMMSRADPIDLYAFPSPNGRKISVMLEELGVPYEYHLINIRKREQFTPAFLAMSPNNKTPVIIDRHGPDGGPITIFESGAVLTYLARKFRAFYGASHRQRVLIDQWVFWQVSGFGPMLGQAEHFKQFAEEHVPYAIDRYLNEAHRLFGVVDKQLSNRDYIADDISIADFAVLGWALTYKDYDISLSEFPRLAKWLQRMVERPATKRGLEALKSL